MDSKKCTCSPGLEEESSDECCSDMSQCAQSKSTPTAKTYSGNDSLTASCLASQSQETYANLTGDRGEDASMLSPADSHAPTLATSEAVANASDSTENALACGITWPESSKKLGLPSSSSRTLRKSATAGLTASFKTLPSSGMIVRGEFIPLAKSERHTKENVSGVWLATPTAHMNVRSERFRAKTPNLSEMVGGRTKANPEYLEWQMGCR